MKRKNQRRPARKPRKPPETQAIVKAQQQAQLVSIPEAIEKVLILGDLASLTPQDRVDYYKRVCDSLGLNPLTMPFSYILFKEFDGGPAKLSLYANKSCTEQLRKIHGVSVIPPLRRYRTADIVTVEADVRDRTGRTDSATGSVPLYKIKDGRRINFDGKDLCNAEMKCETKAKRRATLSICGLAILDESELDTMHVVGGVTPDGRIYEFRDPDVPATGSREAAQDVAQRKIAELTEKASQTAKPAQEPPAAQEQPKQKTTKKPETPVNPDVPKAAALPAMPEQQVKYEVELDWTNPESPILRGQIGDLLPILQKHLHMKWEGEWWHIQPEDAKTLFEMAGPFMFRITEIQPNQVPPGGHSQGRSTTSEGSRAGSKTSQPPGAPPPARKPEGREEAVSTSAASPSGPSIVSGTIERVQPDVKWSVITLVTKDGKKPAWKCFSKTVTDILLKNIGKLAEVIIEERVSKGVTYTNLMGLKMCAGQEYDEDGKTPIIQNKDREAGGKTLF